MKLADLHNAHNGATACVIGNGPSLRTTAESDVRAAADILIGVNDTHRWAPLDYWVSIDTNPSQKGTSYHFDTNGENLATATWVLRRNAHPSPQEVHDGYSRILWIEPGPIDDRQRVLPGMETLAFCQAGTFPGQQLIKARQAKPNLKLSGGRLFVAHSSVMTALHLALVLGCRRILLVGVDLQYQEGGDRRWFERPAPPKHNPPRYIQDSQLARNTKMLNEFWHDWHERVDLVQCSSPCKQTYWWERSIKEMAR